MDGFELRVRQPDPYQKWQLVIRVQDRFEITERADLADQPHRRRNVAQSNGP